MKKPVIIANWKLNGNKKLVVRFLNKLIKFCENNEISNIIIALPYVYLDMAIQLVAKCNKNYFNNCINIAAQNVDVNVSGSFTGEVSVSMLKDIGISHVIIGHSERRMLHNENCNYISKKFDIVKKNLLTPILCIGETKKENLLGLTKIVCKKQIDSIILNSGKKSFINSIIAYEPIWAIGSGKAADIEQIKETHKFIKEYILDVSSINKKLFSVLYGGSVDEKNSFRLINNSYIDGLLVGKSSLDIDIFLKLLNNIKI
ncbi:Triosephosphate isomerase [Buchnera aphidicola (Neophyllaphis podocarpi)]|uniref:triose-phosphate isomerase n=1 Tax=Buchnera aphidicola TaxID=9 RepID=UPI003463A525